MFFENEDEVKKSLEKEIIVYFFEKEQISEYEMVKSLIIQNKTKIYHKGEREKLKIIYLIAFKLDTLMEDHHFPFLIDFCLKDSYKLPFIKFFTEKEAFLMFYKSISNIERVKFKSYFQDIEIANFN